MNKLYRCLWSFHCLKNVIFVGNQAFRDISRKKYIVRSQCLAVSNSASSYNRPLSPEIENNDSEKETLDIVAITGGDPDLEKKLKILILEIDVLRQEGVLVPGNVNVEQWKELLAMPTRSRRLKYLRFLFKTEMKRLNEGKKKREKQEERLKQLEQMKQEENPHIQYGLGRNSLFLRVYDTTINRFYNDRLITAMLFGQKVVLDCSYDSHMVKREAENCAKQIMFAFADNRLHDEPFDLYLCNIKRDSVTMQELHKFIRPMYEDYFPLNVTEKSYLDIFPKEKIVYLTPHCREELISYDHDAVYVIGAVVDKANLGPLSLAKAKREGVKMAKLPLDRYLSWGSGSGKSLTLNQMVKILLEIKSCGDWKKALLHVPRRKLFKPEEKRQFFKRSRTNNYEFRKELQSGGLRAGRVGNTGDSQQ